MEKRIICKWTMRQLGFTGFEDETTDDILVDLHTRENAPSHLRDYKMMAEMREELVRRSVI